MATLDSELVQRFIRTFAGYGSPAARYWFVGMEEACEDDPRELRHRLELWDRRGGKQFEDLHEFHSETSLRDCLAPVIEHSRLGAGSLWWHSVSGEFPYFARQCVGSCPMNSAARRAVRRIAQTATNLAANMGARNIILVGCDNAPLGENHHAHAQHTRWKSVDPQHRYRQYYEGIAEVRATLRKRGINVVAMNPFLKVDAAEHDFARLCDELGVTKVIRGKDVSPSLTKPSLAGKFRKLLRKCF